MGRDLTGVVRVRAWGLWSVPIAQSLARRVGEVCRTGERPTRAVIDCRDLKPQRDEGQAALSAMVEGLSMLGVERITFESESPLTRLMLTRVVKGAPKKTIVELR